jgi:hypothetical protein
LRWITPTDRFDRIAYPVQALKQDLDQVATGLEVT